MQPDDDHPPATQRRDFFSAALLPVFGAALAAAGAAEAQDAQPQSDLLPRRLVVGKPDIPPLDTPVLLARQGEHTDGHTHEVLSLVQQEDGGNSFPWTIYAQLRTKHRGGDAVVCYSRLHKDGPGWSCGFHSEVFSKNWGVGIGMNIEMQNAYEGTEGFNGIIGIEMQSLGPQPVQSGLQIEGQGPYNAMVRLRATAETGIDISGACRVGIHLHGNALRLDEGTFVQLDADGKVKLRYSAGNIEFFNGERRVAHIPVDGEDHQL